MLDPNLRELLDELLDLESGLTEWEVDFIERVNRKTAARGVAGLSPAERARIQAIHKDRVESPAPHDDEDDL